MKSLRLAAVLATLATPLHHAGAGENIGVGAKPVDGAELIIDGSREMLDEKWTYWEGPRFSSALPIKWKIVEDPIDGGTAVQTDDPAAKGGKYGTADIVTKKKYRDFRLHIEFLIPNKGGNSGVYLQNRYEIQIESPKAKKNIADPYNWKIGPHGIGAFCMEHVPDTNAWRPNGEWQSFHFVFKAATWDGDKPVEPARATVWWNGVKIHDNVPIKKANGGEKVSPTPEGLKLQEHGQDVRFRNIWIVDKSK